MENIQGKIGTYKETIMIIFKKMVKINRMRSNL
jgi:hypothetical protein